MAPAPDLGDMIALREDNPLVRSSAPWRRGRVLHFLWWLLIALALATPLCLIFLMPFRGLEKSFLILLLPSPLLLIALLSFEPERREERLTELWLTRLTREEVVFGTFWWPAITALLLAAILSLGAGFAAGAAGYPLAGPPVALIAMLVMANLILKALRITLALRRHRWRLFFLAPAAMAFDILAVGGVAALCVAGPVGWSSRTGLEPLLALASVPITLGALIGWNLHVAMAWGVQLYYGEIDRVRLRDLFLTLRTGLRDEGA